MFNINIAFCSYLQFTQYPNIFGTEVVTYHIYIYLKYLKKQQLVFLNLQSKRIPSEL